MSTTEMRARLDEMVRVLEEHPDVLGRRIRALRKRRESYERKLDATNEDLALVTAAGRIAKVMPTTEMAGLAGYGREHLYRLQREHGVGADDE